MACWPKCRQSHSRAPDATERWLEALLLWWRDVLLVQLGLFSRIVHLEEAEQTAIRNTAEQVDRATARKAAADIQQTLADLDTNVNSRLALDLLLMRLPGVR